MAESSSVVLECSLTLLIFKRQIELAISALIRYLRISTFFASIRRTYFNQISLAGRKVFFISFAVQDLSFDLFRIACLRLFELLHTSYFLHFIEYAFSEKLLTNFETILSH